jgi:hypothetical protein
MSMKRLALGLAFICSVGPSHEPAFAEGQGTPPLEIVQIDGRKNPELIPQWSAWGYVFRVLSGGPRSLPSSILPHVTPAEQTLIMREADGVQKIDAACVDRHRKLLADRSARKPDDLDKDVRELTLECRWETLHARDRLLAALTPDAAAALTAFVESTKVGTSLSIPRKDLARFREPE